MAENTDQTTSFGGNPVFDLEAIKVLSQNPEQMHYLYMQMIEGLHKELASLKSVIRSNIETYQTNKRQPIRNISGGEGINVTVVEEQATLNIDEDYVREISGGGGPTSPPQDNMPICDGGDVTTLGAVGEGAETADATTWLYESDPDTAVGVAITIQTRTYYDHTSSDPILYMFQRDLVFDRNGRLCQVSGETRTTVDDPEAC